MCSHQIGDGVPIITWYSGSAGLFGNTTVLLSDSVIVTLYWTTVPSGCDGMSPANVSPAAVSGI
jgi:hypothetical protein